MGSFVVPKEAFFCGFFGKFFCLDQNQARIAGKFGGYPSATMGYLFLGYLEEFYENISFE